VPVGILQVCLFVHQLGVHELFDKCCRPDKGVASLEECRFLFDRANNITACRAHARDREKCDAHIGENRADMRTPTFTWKASGKHLDRRHAEASPFLSDANTLTGLALANRLDCLLYEGAAREFYQRVRAMEGATGASFLGDVGVTNFQSPLCSDGLKGRASFTTKVRSQEVPLGCSRGHPDAKSVRQMVAYQSPSTYSRVMGGRRGRASDWTQQRDEDKEETSFESDEKATATTADPQMEKEAHEQLMHLLGANIAD
jgi:hypothetical protein